VTEIEKAMLEYLMKTYQPEVECIEAIRDFNELKQGTDNFCNYRVSGMDDKCPCRAILELRGKP
jgi:hypothetical protein